MKRFAPSSYHSQRQHLIYQIRKRTTFLFAILFLQCSDCQIQNNSKRSDLDAIFKYTVKISATNITFVDPVVIYLLKGNNWTYFTSCSSVSIVNFQHVIADWAGASGKYHQIRESKKPASGSRFSFACFVLIFHHLPLSPVVISIIDTHKFEFIPKLIFQISLVGCLQTLWTCSLKMIKQIWET